MINGDLASWGEWEPNRPYKRVDGTLLIILYELEGWFDDFHIPVTYDVLDEFGISEENLKKWGRARTMQKHHKLLSSARDAVMSLSDIYTGSAEPLEKADIIEVSVYGWHGATAILYPGVQRLLYKLHGDDYYFVAADRCTFLAGVMGSVGLEDLLWCREIMAGLRILEHCESQFLSNEVFRTKDGKLYHAGWV